MGKYLWRRYCSFCFFCISIQVTYTVDGVFNLQAFTKLLEQVQEARKMVKSFERKRAIGEIINQQI